AWTALTLAGSALALTRQEPPALVEDVAAGRLPPGAPRGAAEPLAVHIGPADAGGLVRFGDVPRAAGKSGGELRTIIGRPQDVRLLAAYGYARLIGWTETYELKPDLLAGYEAERERVFTLHLRAGHRW